MKCTPNFSSLTSPILYLIFIGVPFCAFWESIFDGRNKDTVSGIVTVQAGCVLEHLDQWPSPSKCQEGVVVVQSVRSLELQKQGEIPLMLDPFGMQPKYHQIYILLDAEQKRTSGALDSQNHHTAFAEVIYRFNASLHFRDALLIAVSDNVSSAFDADYSCSREPMQLPDEVTPD